MCHRLKSLIYAGRPYGGVAFLWRRFIANLVQVVGSSEDGRCLIITINLGGKLLLQIVNMYFPCSSTATQYSVDLGNCLGFIEDSVDACERTVVVGDFDFPCVTSHVGFTQCQPVFDRLDIAHCDDLIITPKPISFVNGLGYSSFTDHCFTPSSIRHYVSQTDITDSGNNLSDHAPYCEPATPL